VLGAPAHGLHRCPHISAARYKIPTRGHKIRCLDMSAGVNGLGNASATILQHGRPDEVTVSLDHRMRPSNAVRLLRIECGVNSAEDDVGTALPCQSPNLISTQRIPRMDADADDISTLDAAWIHRTECFIDHYGVAERCSLGRLAVLVQPLPFLQPAYFRNADFFQTAGCAGADRNRQSDTVGQSGGSTTSKGTPIEGRVGEPCRACPGQGGEQGEHPFLMRSTIPRF